MIFIFAFPRSASTMFLNLMAQICQSKSVWEPLTRPLSEVDDYENAKLAVQWFRAAPSLRELENYRIDNYYLGRIPEQAFTSSKLMPYRKILKTYLEDIARNYGSNAIVKFVRLLGNTKFVYSIAEELGLKVKYIYLMRNPFEIVYSYYRQGGLNARSFWRVKQVFNYRRQMYCGEDGNLDILFGQAKTALDKLACSVIADYWAMKDSLAWFESKGSAVSVVNYEDFMRRPGQELEKCLSFLDEPGIKERIEQVCRGHRFDVSKIESSCQDPVFSYFVRKSLKRLPQLSPYFSGLNDSTGLRLKPKHIMFLLKNIFGSFKDNFFWWKYL